MGGETVAQHMRRNRFGEAGGPRRAGNRALHDFLVEMVPPDHAIGRIGRAASGRKNVLPNPAPPGLRVLARQPVISVDTKKKELVGLFKNPGTVWVKTATPVFDHDFRSDAKAIAVPYGVQDIGANRGHIFVGTSHDTPQYALASVTRWWTADGSLRYPDSRRVLVLADNGGSNGSRCRAWKYEIQRMLADPHRLEITVCHYPSGASKWNPIEHQLFSPQRL